MRLMMAVAGMLALAAAPACTSYESAYERGVYAYEPVYCYRSLADVQCMRIPFARDERRLVNYYGPAPGKYDPRPAPPEAELQPPPELDTAAGAEDEPAVGDAGSADDDVPSAAGEHPEPEKPEPDSALLST